jgi:hypothetical protein
MMVTQLNTGHSRGNLTRSECRGPRAAPPVRRWHWQLARLLAALSNLAPWRPADDRRRQIELAGGQRAPHTGHAGAPPLPPARRAGMGPQARLERGPGASESPGLEDPFGSRLPALMRGGKQQPASAQRPEPARTLARHAPASAACQGARPRRRNLVRSPGPGVSHWTGPGGASGKQAPLWPLQGT